VKIYIDGELNGVPRKKLDLLMQEIITFTDLKEFIDQPVRTYSTGMKARLGFALISFIEPEILIIDEALSAGDAEFGKKASKKMRELCDQGNIVILVSHSMAAIRKMCNRCIWMENGSIIMDGSPEKVTEEYLESIRIEDEKQMRLRFMKRIGPRDFHKGCEIRKLVFIDNMGRSRAVWRSDETMSIHFELTIQTKVFKPDFKLSFEKLDGNILLENWAKQDGCFIEEIEGTVSYEIEFGRLDLGEDIYAVQLEFYGNTRDDIPELLAAYCEMIKVERPVGSIDSPSYFCPIEVTSQKLSENYGDY
jgi:lipopolysaccharide transport system ATP-binding protein